MADVGDPTRRLAEAHKQLRLAMEALEDEAVRAELAAADERLAAARAELPEGTRELRRVHEGG